jgi:predicted nucleotidyltransferase
VKTVGIIVEYNPLHNGHVYHLQQTRLVSGADAVVAVMSGNFLQRGEPAVVDKWARTEMALRQGVDLVIELPVAYASQPAEWFAFGAVSLLDATGIVDSFCFGSESGELGWMRQLAKLLHAEPDRFRDLLRERLKTGENYPSAYSHAIREFAAEWSEAGEWPLEQPNNTLGLHYLIALERLGSSMQPLTIARRHAAFHQQRPGDGPIASATAIRRLISSEGRIEGIAPFVPASTLDILLREHRLGRAPIDWSSFAMPLMHQLLIRPAEELAQICEVTEGLEYRLKQALPRLKDRPSVEELLRLLKTKRYTRTKLQRTLTRILLHHDKQSLSPERLRRGAGYLRVLGFSGTGRELLKRMKTAAKVPVVVQPAGNAVTDFLAMDIQAASVYALAYERPTQQDLFRDYYQPPIRV